MRLISAIAVGLITAFGTVPAYSHGDDVKFGGPADPKANLRVIDIVIEEKPDGSLAYSPKKIDIKVGEDIKFVVENKAKAKHDFLIGPEALVDEHVKELIATPHGPDAPFWTSIEPGTKGELLWHFPVAVEIDFASPLTGDVEKGLLGAISVKQ